jgi:hypothetical protein
MNLIKWIDSFHANSWSRSQSRNIYFSHNEKSVSYYPCNHHWLITDDRDYCLPTNLLSSRHLLPIYRTINYHWCYWLCGNLFIIAIWPTTAYFTITPTTDRTIYCIVVIIKLFAFELAGKETVPSWFPVHRRLNFIWNFPKRLIWTGNRLGCLSCPASSNAESSTSYWSYQLLLVWPQWQPLPFMNRLAEYHLSYLLLLSILMIHESIYLLLWTILMIHLLL